MVEVGEKGPTSYISLFREQQKKFDNNQMFGGDKVYQGGKNISPSYKKPGKGESTSEHKAGNKEFSTKGIFFEQVIGIFFAQVIRLVKILRVPEQRFPLNFPIYSQVILTICGLFTLGIGSLVFPISYMLWI